MIGEKEKLLNANIKRAHKVAPAAAAAEPYE